jgi:hypothetical protein
MYSWDDDTADWYRPGAYKYDSASEERRRSEAARAAAAGPRSYAHRREPNAALIAPTKRLRTESRNPLIVAVDVTGSMANWPFEIFDRLPLLYNTLAQYRDDLEICFAAIGDAAADHWPLQVTDFAKGYDLEQQLGALYGEGGGGDAPESYGLFAYWARHHVEVPNAERPFLIVFGDAPMHVRFPAEQVRRLLGDGAQQPIDALAEWRALAQKWDTWFLRRPTGRAGDEVDVQWRDALGAQRVVHMQDEQRAVDYAMGLVARTWGRFGDFKENMAARQDTAKIDQLERQLDEVKVRALKCPGCGAPIPASAVGRFACAYCHMALHV